MTRQVTAWENARLSIVLGMLLMTFASLAVPAVDGIAKALSERHSPLFVAWARYAAATAIIVPLLAILYKSSYRIRDDLSFNILRTLLAVGAMLAFFSAIALIPLAAAFGGYFMGPVVAMFLASFTLRERLTGPRWTAIGLGLLGTYLVLEPWAEPNIGTLLAVISGLLFAGYLVTTRAAAATPPLDALRFQCVFGVLLLTPLAVLNWSQPSAHDLALIAAMGAISASCHVMVLMALKHAEVSVLSPLTYLELVSATLIGLIFFAEVPDTAAVVGIGLIVLAGMIAWAATRRRLPS